MEAAAEKVVVTMVTAVAQPIQALLQALLLAPTPAWAPARGQVRARGQPQAAALALAGTRRNTGNT